jgi:hypothetical protein
MRTIVERLHQEQWEQELLGCGPIRQGQERRQGSSDALAKSSWTCTPSGGVSTFSISSLTHQRTENAFNGSASTGMKYSRATTRMC